jgi:hypothetical protein
MVRTLAVNPRYAALVKETSGGTAGTDERNLPIWNWGKVGDVLIGTITFVGDFFEADNSKFYTPEEHLFDAEGNKVFKPAKGMPTITKQKIIVETKDNGKFAVYFSKKGHWSAIDAGLMVADIADLMPGIRFRGERMENDDKAHVFDFKFKPAQA